MGPCNPRGQVGAPTGLTSERTEGEIQAQTLDDTAEPGGGHAGGGEKGWGLLLPLEDNRWRADLGDQLIRVRLALRPYRGRVTRPPRQLLPLQETHRRASRRRKELSQAACCFGTIQTPAVEDSIKRTCQRT